MQLLKVLLVPLIYYYSLALLGFSIPYLLLEYDQIEFYVSYNWIIEIIDHLIVFFIVYYLIARQRIDWKKDLSLKKLNFNVVAISLMVLVALAALRNVVFDFDSIIDYFLNGVDPTPPKERILTINKFLNYHLSAIVLAPIMEELIFRKYILTELSKRMSIVWALVISSLLFMAMHLPDYSNLVPTFILGILSGIIYFKTGRIVYSIIFHFFYNVIATWDIFYDNSIKAIMEIQRFNMWYWIFPIVSLFVVWYSMKKITAANNGYKQ